MTSHQPDEGDRREWAVVDNTGQVLERFYGQHNAEALAATLNASGVPEFAPYAAERR